MSEVAERLEGRTETVPAPETPSGETTPIPEREPDAEPEPLPGPRVGLVWRFPARFVCIYLLLYNSDFLTGPLRLVLTSLLAWAARIGNLGLSAIPGAGLWDRLVVGVAQRLFGVTITVRPNGSGDTTYNYVELVCSAILALVLTFVWSLVARRRADSERLHEWLRLLVRFALGSAMVSYGAIKVIQSQFPEPGLDRLLQPFGDASPMGLLWTFMGASASYNAFTGSAEMASGLLLILSRRTVLLGALASVVVLVQIVALNFCYDVPVKLYSGHLLLMAVFLAAPDLPRLWALFVLGRGVGPSTSRRLLGPVWLDRAGVVLRTLLVALFVFQALLMAQAGRLQYQKMVVGGPLYGIWEVEEYVVDGQVRPPLTTDPTRWQRVVFANTMGFSVLLKDSRRERFGLKDQAPPGTLQVTRRGDPNWGATLQYTQPEPGRLVLEGSFDGKPLRVGLRKVEAPEFPLRTRGFHWINEYPFNR